MLRVADSKTMNHTRLMDFFIVDGDLSKKARKDYFVKRKIGKSDKDFSS